MALSREVPAFTGTGGSWAMATCSCPTHVIFDGGGEVTIGFEDGRHDWFSAYGHKPWQDGYKDKARDEREWVAMEKFKAEWAATYGPEFRGVTNRFALEGEAPLASVDEAYWLAECQRDNEYLKQPGERARRRHLTR